ncbi:MAG: YfhO family protein [Rikenellaceae bacterium]
MIESSKWLKKFLPAVCAVVVFLAINAIYFSPQFRGEKVKSHDVTQYRGMGRDAELHKQEFGEDPQWAGRMFGGMPSTLINMKKGVSIVPKARKAVEFLGYPAGHIFAAMVCFYCMLLLFGMGPWVSIPFAIAYGLSSYMFIIIGAGHVTKMAALAYAPLMLGTVFYAYRKNMFLGSAMAAFVSTIEIAAGHPQITYYFGFVIAAFAINEAVIAYKNHTLPKFFKTSALLAVAAALALLANFGSMYYTAVSSKDSMRGGSELTKGEGKQDKGLSLDYATMWSYGKVESFNMLVPNLVGGESGGGFASEGKVAASLGKYNARSMATQLPGYWGPQPMTSGPVYIGAVIIFIAVFGFFALSGLASWWVLIVSAIALMLAWGNNFMWFTELFFNYLPGYNKFRTVSMILVILQWSLPFVAAVGLSNLFKGEIDKARAMKALKRSAIVVGGVCLVLFAFGSSLFSFSSASDEAMKLPSDVLAAMRAERADLLRSDALRSLIFVALSCALLWAVIEGKLKKNIVIALLSVMIVVDLLGVNVRYLNKDNFVAPKEDVIMPTSADKQILQDKELGYRVANFSVSIFNDATTSYFHRSVGGYHGAKLGRYQDLIDNQLSKMNMGVYNMMNTKYFISRGQDSQLKVEINPQANGAAWFVDSLFVTSTPRMEMDALSVIDTKKTAVVDESFVGGIQGVEAQREGAREIALVDYYPNRLVYDYKADKAQVVVFSEIYYPKGWTAYIDGKPADYFRVNYLLRAMVVPQGEHRIEFKYRAENFDKVTLVALISSLAIILALVVAVFIYFRKKYVATKQQ